MSSNVKLAYGTSTSVTITLASLASAGARECTAIDNTSNLFLAAEMYLAIKLQSGSPTGDKAIYVYVYGSEDGTNYTDNATGSDAGVTMRSPSNLILAKTISCPDSGGLTYKSGPISVEGAFGGFIPRKWGFVVLNSTGITFSATEGDHTKSYTGLYSTVG